MLDRFDGPRQVVPVLAQPALPEHIHPAGVLQAAKGESYWLVFDPLQKIPLHRSPYHDHADPSGDRNHQERKEECGDKELIDPRQPTVKYLVHGVKGQLIGESSEGQNIHRAEDPASGPLPILCCDETLHNFYGDE
jgi:hypothetical protein